jgi:hypothetical protein
VERRGDWRTEADDAWLVSHRSTILAQFRRRFRGLSGLAGSVSQAELGPFGGAPRNPRLRIGGKAYAVVRYAHHRIAYTAVLVDLHRCRFCGHRFAETHRIQVVREAGGRVVVGAVQLCRRCQADSWMFRSHMPTAVAARRRKRNYV